MIFKLNLCIIFVDFCQKLILTGIAQIMHYAHDNLSIHYDCYWYANVSIIWNGVRCNCEYSCMTWNLCYTQRGASGSAFEPADIKPPALVYSRLTRKTDSHFFLNCKKNCKYDQIPLNLKRNDNLFV